MTAIPAPTAASNTGRARRRTLAASLASAALGVGAVLAVGMAPAAADEGGMPPEHGHIFVLGVQFGEDSITYRKCIDLAAGQALPLHVHHATIHRGKAGDALREAGNFVVPTAPLMPWANCAEFEQIMRG